MRSPSSTYLYGFTSTFGATVNVTAADYAAVDADMAAEIAAERTDRTRFRALLTDPTTGPRLDAMLADNARIDAQLREDDRLEDLRQGDDGDTCGAACGYCGRCS